MSKINDCREVFQVEEIETYCHCGMQESSRSELSNNCAKISGIFSPPVQMIFFT